MEKSCSEFVDVKVWKLWCSKFDECDEKENNKKKIAYTENKIMCLVFFAKGNKKKCENAGKITDKRKEEEEKKGKYVFFVKKKVKCCED